MFSRSYKFNNSQFTIVFGNILNTNAEVVVSSDDSYISMGGGVSAAILKKCGPQVQIDAKRCLDIINTLGISSIAFPTIGAGHAGLELQKVVCFIIDEIATFLSNTNKIFNKLVVFISSENSNASVNVYNEIQEAIGQKKKLLPIKIDNAPYSKEINFDLRNVDYIEYSRSDNFIPKVINNIKLLLIE